MALLNAASIIHAEVVISPVTSANPTRTHNIYRDAALIIKKLVDNPARTAPWDFETVHIDGKPIVQR